MGGRSIACLNARDRNAQGFRRDLLTGAAYGIDEFLFVYGDAPVSGARTGQLTMRSMIEYLRQFSDEHQGRAARFRVGVTARLQALPSWKGCSRLPVRPRGVRLGAVAGLARHVTFDGDVYAGVMILPSASMARKLVADIPEITIPERWIDAVETDRRAGVELACELAQSIADSGAFDGVYLIPGVRYRETAALLEKQRLT